MNKLQESLKLLGAVKLDGDWKASCPLCQREEEDPHKYKLCVSPGDSRVIVLRCWRCCPVGDKQAARRYFPALCDAVGLDRDYLTSNYTREEIAEHWREADSKIKKQLPPTADYSTLHNVYESLLDELQLTPAHRNWLEKRGLSPEWASGAGYRSCPNQPEGVAAAMGNLWDCTLFRIPGFFGPSVESIRLLTRTNAILTPCRDYKGRIVALKQRIIDGKRGRIRLLSSSTVGGPKAVSIAHCPLGVGAVRWNKLWITEGERKADVLWTRNELPAIAIPGTGQFRTVFPILDQVLQPGGEVVLAMDKDAAGEQCTKILAPLLQKIGYRTQVATWTGGKGCDDVREYEISEYKEQRSNPTQSISLDLNERGIVEFVKKKGQVLRDTINAYQPTVSKLIRDGVLRIASKGSFGQLLEVAE